VFFRRLKAGERPGYPRFKGYAHFDSFGYKELNNGFRIDGRRLKLAAVGRVAAGIGYWRASSRRCVSILPQGACKVSFPIPLPSQGGKGFSIRKVLPSLWGNAPSPTAGEAAMGQI